MASFKFEIVSPDGVVWEGQAKHVRAPGVMGSFGVLPGHTPFMTPLQVGEINLSAEDGEFVFATSGGTAEVQGDHVLILAETAEDVAKIDVERAQASADRAKERLVDRSAKDVDFKRAEMALFRSINRLKLSKG